MSEACFPSLFPRLSWSRMRPLTVDAARDDDADLMALETDRDKKRKEIAKDMTDLAPMGKGSPEALDDDGDDDDEDEDNDDNDNEESDSHEEDEDVEMEMNGGAAAVGNGAEAG